MMKRIAAAVLYTVVTATGVAGATGAAADLDDDDDVTVTIEKKGEPDEKQPQGVLRAAGLLCGRPIEAAWIASGLSNGCAAVAVSADDAHVSIVDIAIRGWHQRPVHLEATLRQALDHCRHTGALKVLVNLESLPADQVRATAGKRGFAFTRYRRVDGIPMAEFYTDLYWSDGISRRS